MVCVWYEASRPDVIVRGAGATDDGEAVFMTIRDESNGRSIGLGKGLGGFWRDTVKRQSEKDQSKYTKAKDVLDGLLNSETPDTQPQIRAARQETDQARRAWYAANKAIQRRKRKFFELCLRVLERLFSQFVGVQAWSWRRDTKGGPSSSWKTKGASRRTNKRRSLLSIAEFHDMLARRFTSPGGPNWTVLISLSTEAWTTRITPCCGMDLGKVGTKKYLKCTGCNRYFLRDVGGSSNQATLTKRQLGCNKSTRPLSDSSDEKAEFATYGLITSENWNARNVQ